MSAPFIKTDQAGSIRTDAEHGLETTAIVTVGPEKQNSSDMAMKLTCDFDKKTATIPKTEHDETNMQSFRMSRTALCVACMLLVLTAVSFLLGFYTSEWTDNDEDFHLDSPSAAPTQSQSPTAAPTRSTFNITEDSIVGKDNGSWFGESVSLSRDGSVLAVGASERYAMAKGDMKGVGCAYVFHKTSIEWIQKGRALCSDQQDDLFGTVVQLSSDGAVLMVGTHLVGSFRKGPGYMRIYRFDDSTGQWSQVGNNVNPDLSDSVFGSNMVMSKDGTTIGSFIFKKDRLNNLSERKFHVFRYSPENGRWTRRGNEILVPSTRNLDFGSATMSYDGNLVAIGAAVDDPAPRVYRLDDADESGTGEWQQVGQQLPAVSSVHLSSDGSRLCIDMFHVAVFEFDKTQQQWIQMGQDVSISDILIAVFSGNGSTVAAATQPNSNSQINVIRVFRHDDDNQWNEIDDPIYGEDAGDSFGSSLALSEDGTILVIGAPYPYYQQLSDSHWPGGVYIRNIK